MREKRNLDGVYFRIKRDGKWDNICFSDLTEEERNEVMSGKTVEWFMNLCNILVNTIRKIGDEFDIVVD